MRSDKDLEAEGCERRGGCVVQAGGSFQAGAPRAALLGPSGYTVQCEAMREPR